MGDKPVSINPTPLIIHTEHPGSREAVKAAIAKAVQLGVDGKPDADQSLCELAKDSSSKLLDMLPLNFNAAIVRTDARFTGRGLRLVINVDGCNTL